MFKAPNRKYYNGNEYYLDKNEKKLVLDEKFHKRLFLNKRKPFGYKKITGTSLGDILKVDSFKSEFAAYARLCGLQMPVLDPKYINAGVILEPKILEKVEKSLNEDLQRFNAQEYQYDYFKENEIFGGLPDGYSRNRKKIIEIKTTNEKNYDFWKNVSIPIGYIKQAQLYTYLMNAKSFSIVAIFLKNEDYEDPNSVDINKRIIKNFDFPLNVAQVQDDMKIAQEWYEKYTQTGYSPQYNELIDKDLVEYLECKNVDEWTILFNKWIEQGKAVPIDE